jgi:hypothetical protein
MAIKEKRIKHLAANRAYSMASAVMNFLVMLYISECRKIISSQGYSQIFPHSNEKIAKPSPKSLIQFTDFLHAPVQMIFLRGDAI